MAAPPIDVEKLVRDFSGTVPLFPLPSLVFFPDTIVPLLVFEDRYRVMMREALEGERLLGMALLKPGWEADPEGNPPIHERVCVGTVLTHELLPDGRYKLLLYGLFRADIVEETQQSPYRKAKVKVSRDEVHPTEASDLDERLHRALAMLPGRRGRIGGLRRLAADLRGRGGGPGRLADAAAESAELDTEDRYKILAESDVLRRLDLLVTLLERKARASPDSLPPRVDPSLN
jgi:Lon protease-like protein